jgi:hypothetical protein
MKTGKAKGKRMQTTKNTVLIVSQKPTIISGSPYVLLPKVCRGDITPGAEIEFYGMPGTTDILMRIVEKKKG